jgi:hypothetical protein
VTDIVTARTHALPWLYPVAAAGLPTLTDKGYEGAGIGIIVPCKGTNLNADAVSRNAARVPGRLPHLKGAPWFWTDTTFDKPYHPRSGAPFTVTSQPTDESPRLSLGPTHLCEGVTS